MTNALLKSATLLGSMLIYDIWKKPQSRLRGSSLSSIKWISCICNIKLNQSIFSCRKGVRAITYKPRIFLRSIYKTVGFTGQPLVPWANSSSSSKLRNFICSLSSSWCFRWWFLIFPTRKGAAARSLRSCLNSFTVQASVVESHLLSCFGWVKRDWFLRTQLLGFLFQKLVSYKTFLWLRAFMQEESCSDQVVSMRYAVSAIKETPYCVTFSSDNYRWMLLSFAFRTNLECPRCLYLRPLCIELNLWSNSFCID